MKIRPLAQPDIVSIERIIAIVAEEDEIMNSGELDEGTYALDSVGRVWRLVETVSGLVSEFTESDGIKRRRAKRTSKGT